MRVVMDCRMAGWTGVGRYTHGLVRAMARQPEVEVVQIVAAGEAPPTAGAEAVTASRHPFSLGGAREMSALIGRLAPDVTHCLHFPTPLPAPHPLVVTLHDLSPLIVPGVMPSALKRAVYRWWNVRALRRADAVIAVSHNTAEDLARLVPGAASRIETVLEAADDFTAGPLGELPAALAGARYVLAFGNAKPHKDLPTLLHAFSLLAEDTPGLRLVLVGEEAPGLRAALGANADRALFTGRVSDAELRALYARAAAFAFPSRYEGFGLPPLEAMALGTPVVAAASSSIPEVVGDAALLFPPGDAAALARELARVLAEPALRDDLVARGRDRAGQFSWERTAERTAAAYGRLLTAEDRSARR